jgi:hypothetical protein
MRMGWFGAGSGPPRSGLGSTLSRVPPRHTTRRIANLGAHAIASLAAHAIASLAAVWLPITIIFVSRESGPTFRSGTDLGGASRGGDRAEGAVYRPRSGSSRSRLVPPRLYVSEP